MFSFFHNTGQKKEMGGFGRLLATLLVAVWPCGVGAVGAEDVCPLPIVDSQISYAFLRRPGAATAPRRRAEVGDELLDDPPVVPSFQNIDVSAPHIVMLDVGAGVKIPVEVRNKATGKLVTLTAQQRAQVEREAWMNPDNPEELSLVTTLESEAVSTTRVHPRQGAPTSSLVQIKQKEKIPYFLITAAMALWAGDRVQECARRAEQPLKSLQRKLTEIAATQRGRIAVTSHGCYREGRKARDDCNCLGASHESRPCASAKLDVQTTCLDGVKEQEYSLENRLDVLKADIRAARRQYYSRTCVQVQDFFVHFDDNMLALAGAVSRELKMIACEGIRWSMKKLGQMLDNSIRCLTRHGA